MESASAPAPRPRGAVRRWLPWVALTAALLGCGGLGYSAFEPRNSIRVGPLEADLRAAVQPGSPKGAAEAWFAAHGIRYGLTINGASGRHVGYFAVVPNDTWLEPAEIRIVVNYDEQGRVTGVTIYRFVYSL